MTMEIRVRGIVPSVCLYEKLKQTNFVDVVNKFTPIQLPTIVMYLLPGFVLCVFVFC